MGLPLRVSGDLRDVDPALLLRSLTRTRETGRLALTDGERSLSLWLASGAIVFAASNDPDDSLGAWLVRSGRLALDALARYEPKVSRERRLGAVLVEEGELAPDELVGAVSGQLRAIVEAVVLATRGRYWFDFSEVELKELIVLRADPRALLLGGLRRVASVSRVRRGLAHGLGRRWVPAGAETLQALELHPAEEQVLAALGGEWDGERVPAVAGLDPFAVARALWAFEVTGALVSAASRRTTPAPRAGSAPTPRAALALPAEETAPDPELEAAVRELNDRHQTLFRAVRVEIGAGAEPFLRGAIGRLAPSHAELFAGIDFLPLGRFEAGRLLERAERRPPGEVRAAFEALLALELEEFGRAFGAEREAALRERLAAGPAGEEASPGVPIR